jgi:hypothetical protein
VNKALLCADTAGCGSRKPWSFSLRIRRSEVVVVPAILRPIVKVESLPGAVVSIRSRVYECLVCMRIEVLSSVPASVCEPLW